MPRTKRTKAYLALAERVRAINPEAAEFLMGEEIERLPTFTTSGEGLMGYFYWGESPQGSNYWQEIANAL